jgi:8-oxo-dGTP diphosphatase
VAQARARQPARLGLIVRAAGGVVHRRGASGDVEVLLVHRPKYDDWSFPKGKAGPGESDTDCALREVEEETGLRCRLEEELASTRYHDSRGRPKLVRYWAMEAMDGAFAPGREVDAVRWAGREDAAELLTWARDRDVLQSLRR